MRRNCTVCSGQYDPYKTGPDEDVTAFYCEVPSATAPTQGVCQFHNPVSKLFVGAP